MNATTYTSLEKPGLVKTIAVLTLINGIVNIFWGLVATATVTASIILICLAPLTILPTILGIFEIIYAARLLAEPMQPVQPSQTIAVLEILTILTGNVFSTAVGILALVFYNDSQVVDYFNRLNGMPVPDRPAPPRDVTPAPVMDGGSSSDPAAPDAEPAKPSKRKAAGKTGDSPEDEAVG